MTPLDRRYLRPLKRPLYDYENMEDGPVTARDFCYWLQGHFEINAKPNDGLSAAQVDMIQRHLALVFIHEIDPANAGGDPNKAAEAQNIHDGQKRYDSDTYHGHPGYGAGRSLSSFNGPVGSGVPNQYPISC